MISALFAYKEKGNVCPIILYWINGLYERFMSMDKFKLIKIGLYFVILVVLCYFSVGYSYELYGIGLENINMNNVEANVDGADFSPFIMLMGYGVNGILATINTVVYAVVVMILGLILLLPFCFVGLSKKRNVTIEEYKIYKNVAIVTYVVAFLIGCILTRFTGVLILFFYNTIWFTEVLIFVIMVAKKHLKAE
ncbi:MAG: hypothetical protein J6C84_10720 [Lachnospiraceae bacterium]|nr:hypothetical protein [Lachnospiraceae bacterium]